MAEVITYWDGYKDIQVYDFNHLKELSQEETNTIVVGPQETFFEKLELINRELRYAGNEEIDVTKDVIHNIMNKYKKQTENIENILSNDN